MRYLIQCIFRLLGWKMVGDLPPNVSKAVLIAAPHTSNWDFFYGMAMVFIKRIPAKFAIKKEVMFFPLGPILTWMGAIPIDRHRSAHPNQAKPTKQKTQVAGLIDLLEERQKLFLIIAPEGTRRYVTRWKTGFYYVALQANVPIVLGYLDYAKKEAGIGPAFYPTGNLEADMNEIKAFYRDKTAKYPQQGVY